MADEEQLAILKQGFEAWNAWRKQAGDIVVDLREANVRGFDLRGIDLRGAYLGRADLRETYLLGTNFGKADLRGAYVHRGFLPEAILFMADLREAYLRKANFFMADLREAKLSGADFDKAFVSGTNFSNVDLSGCKHLGTINHYGPSSVDIRTLQRSGPLPLAFLRGVGLPDNVIEYLPSLLNQAIQHYSCFISYSSKDDGFARRLHADLQEKGVRCWFAPEDMKIGAKILDTLDQAIRTRQKVVLILSEAWIAAEWVEIEVKNALAEERQRGTTVLFPVRLDDAVFATKEAWAVLLRDDRNIGDFRAWKDHDSYQKALERVLRNLQVEAEPDAAAAP
jgi:uncharacterized protein YjbI with pentapeptide repeats